MGLAVCFLACATTSCVVTVSSDQQDGGAGTANTQNKVCPAEYLSEAKRKQIYQKASDNLASAGQPVDATVWSDAARFEAYIKEVYKVAGCTPPSDSEPAGSQR